MTSGQVLVGEVQEFVDGRWRTVHLGENVSVRDRRRRGFGYEPPPMFPFRVRPDPSVPANQLRIVQDGRVLGVFDIPGM